MDKAAEPTAWLVTGLSAGDAGVEGLELEQLAFRSYVKRRIFSPSALKALGSPGEGARNTKRPRLQAVQPPEGPLVVDWTYEIMSMRLLLDLKGNENLRSGMGGSSKLAVHSVPMQHAWCCPAAAFEDSGADPAAILAASWANL